MPCVWTEDSIKRVLFADSKDKAYGGHLDRGICVGAVVEAMILEFGGMKLKRVFNPKTNLYIISSLKQSNL